MTFNQRLFVMGVVVFLLLAIMSLVYRRKLRAGQGLMWSGLMLVAFVIMLFPQVMTFISDVTGAKYPVSALTLLTFAVLVVVIVMQEGRIVGLERRQTKLIREIGMLHRYRGSEAREQQDRDE